MTVAPGVQDLLHFRESLGWLNKYARLPAKDAAHSVFNFMGYAPLFEEIVDSSLWEEPDVVIKVFLTMLAKKNWKHEVMGDAYRISKWARKEELETVAALKVLERPDTKRKIKQEFDGRRIQKIDGGWLILNGEKYQKEMAKVNRRVYQRKWKQEKALAKNPTPVTEKEFPINDRVPPGASADAIALAKDVKGDERLRDQDPADPVDWNQPPEPIPF